MRLLHFAVHPHGSLSPANAQLNQRGKAVQSTGTISNCFNAMRTHDFDGGCVMITGSGISRSTRRNFLTGFCVIACAVAGKVNAQTDIAGYPDRPVRIVVPYPPGGGSDILARVLAEKLQSRWGQPVVVENHPGASGNVGTEAVF